MSLQFNAAPIKPLHRSDKFSGNYHLEIIWQGRWNFWKPLAFGFISTIYHGKSTAGCRVPIYVMGSGLHFQGHRINKLQSQPFCSQYLSSCSLIPTDVSPDIHVISHIYPTDCLKYPLTVIHFHLSDKRSVSQPACLLFVGAVGAQERRGDVEGCCSTETHIYMQKELQQRTNPDSQPPR